MIDTIHPKATYELIGLMSGTSLDGLDIAYCRFEKKEDSWTYKLLHTENITYDTDFRKQLKNAVHLNAVDLLHFHNELGTWFGEQSRRFIEKNKITVDAVASHGQTIFHQPLTGMTCQIGSGQHLANACQNVVISDFRTNDVALGGQGAPLVPIGDQILFQEYDYCLNLGGISNISFDNNGNRLAYDIAPVNMLLGHLTKKLNLDYDDRGEIAKSGICNQSLWNDLQALPYYKESPPKSLGVEWFSKYVIPIIENVQDTIPNLLHTAVLHIANQIAANILQRGKKSNCSVLVTGGGAKNDFLIQEIQRQIQGQGKLILPDLETIDYKEALIFAFMGALRLRKENNCLRSVTGARKDSCGGVVYLPS